MMQKIHPRLHGILIYQIEQFLNRCFTYCIMGDYDLLYNQQFILISILSSCARIIYQKKSTSFVYMVK